jgi:hypothetical protein
MLGPYINGAAIAVGGVVGAALGDRIPERVRLALPLTFGACAICMGIVLMLQAKHLPAIVLSIIVGALIGELIYLEQGISRASDYARALTERVMPRTVGNAESEEHFLQGFVALVVLFSASGMGIFGAMKEGISGDSSILVAKAILDLFTAMIFATTLGYVVALIAIPQMVVQLALAYGAGVIMPHTTPVLMADFSAVGGILLLATGMRISEIKAFRVANMLPAIALAMPISYLWSRFF